MSTVVRWRQAGLIKQLRTYAESRWLPHLLAVLSFVLVTAYYMTPQALHCQTTVYGFGDNTAGLIWRNGVSSNNPLWGPENVTNYPYGEDLSSPVNYIAVLHFSLYWVLAKIAGPICGFNLLNFIGFVATAAVMYGFIYWLTHKKSIAWLAGFAVSFSPYFQNQVGSHSSYGYAAFLILALWLYLRLLRERHWLDVPLLALVIAVCVYWDPYFSLLVATILAPLVVVTVVYSYLQVRGQGRFLDILKALWRRLLPFVLVGVLTLVLILPLAVIARLNAAQINAQVGGVRDSNPINVITIYCTNKPSDYLIPTATNYFADALTNGRYAATVQRFKHGCNPAEYNVGLSLTLLTVLVIGGVVFVRKYVGKRRLRALFAISRSGLEQPWIMLSVMGVLAAGFLLGLPAVLTTRHFPSPTYFLLQVTQIWRVFSREYVVVNIAVVTLAALSLYFLAPLLRDRSWVKHGVFVLLCLSIFVEFQAFPPLSGSATTFSYETDVPTIYQWARTQSDIQHVAVYPIIPIGEGGDPLLYAITMQTINQKQLLNSTVSNSPQDALHLSLRDLTAPQTLPTLRGLGIDTLEIHGIPEHDIAVIPGIEIMRYESVADMRFGSYGSMIAFAKIVPGPAQNFALTLESGFSSQVSDAPVTGVDYTAVNNSHMKLTPLTYDAQSNAQHMACFEVATAAATGTDELTVLVDGTPVVTALPINGQYARVRFGARENQSIVLRDGAGQDMRVRNLGCPAS
jgi:hypothetical protein